MRTSHTLLSLGIVAALVGIAMAGPVAADEIVTNGTTGLVPGNSSGNGGDGPLFSTVKFFHHGYGGGGWGYPYYGGYSYGYPNRWSYGDGYGYYTKGNQVCVFSGYGYRCYTPRGSYYY